MGDPLRHHGVLLGGNQEVGDACQKANVGLGAKLTDSLIKKLDLVASQDLATFELGARARVRLGDVPLHVGVADDGEDTNLSHDAGDVDVDHQLGLFCSRSPNHCPISFRCFSFR